MLLRLIERGQPLLEELVLDFVILRQSRCNFLSGLVVPELAGFREDDNIGGRVDFLEDHFELVEKPEGHAAFALHDLVDGLAVELDVQVAKRGLQLFEVCHAVGDDVSGSRYIFKRHLLGREELEVGLLIELVEQLSEEVAAREILLEARDFLQNIRASKAYLG